VLHLEHNHQDRAMVPLPRRLRGPGRSVVRVGINLMDFNLHRESQ
jgi:hypothetical protein